MEMEQWWKRHENIDLGEYERDKVEDVTGCIPLLLNQCVVHGRIDLTVPKWRKIRSKAVGFAQHIRRTTQGLEWKWCVRLI